MAHFPIFTPTLITRHSRLFELIRQENLALERKELASASDQKISVINYLKDAATYSLS